MPNGDVVAGGDRFSMNAGGQVINGVARWDGKTWQAVGGGTDQEVDALAVMPNGDLVVGGRFKRVAPDKPASGIAVWDGAAWHALGKGVDLSVNSLAILKNGDIVAGGFFRKAGGIEMQSIARWDGKAWSAMGEGMTGDKAGLMTGDVMALAPLPDGRLVAGG